VVPAQEKQSVIGVGPSIGFPVVVFAASAGAVTHRWPGVFLLRSVPRAVFLIDGAARSFQALRYCCWPWFP
jgi:hypothetical protein